jgi:hypothetical protein
MKRLMLLAVLAASLLAWAAPASAGKIAILYTKTDSIWARVGYVGGTPGGALLSEATKYRHFIDSTGVLKNCGSCTRFWAEIVQLKNPDAASGVDTVGTMYMSMRSHNDDAKTNDSLIVDLPLKAQAVSTTAESGNRMDSAFVYNPYNVGTDSTAGWNEIAVQLNPNVSLLASNSASNFMWTGHVGQIAIFGNAYYNQLAVNPSFKWRIAGKYVAGQGPRLMFYKLTIYCYKGD